MDGVVKAGFKHKDAAIAIKEIAENLKKKNQKLQQQNTKLFEEMKQHEEDSKDGYEMLLNVKERERILKIELEESKAKLQKKESQIHEYHSEKDLVETMKSSFERKKRVSDKILKDLQVDNENLKKKADEQRTIVEKKEREHQKDLNSIKEEIKEIKKNNVVKEEMLVTLEKERYDLGMKLKNIEEENFAYISEIKDLDKIKVEPQMSTVKSLEDELEECQVAEKFQCN